MWTGRAEMASPVFLYLIEEKHAQQLSLHVRKRFRRPP